MNADYLEFYKRMGLLEIVTIDKVPDSRDVDGAGYVKGVFFKNAYGKSLEDKYPFAGIEWDKMPFMQFRILKEYPPLQLRQRDDKTISFDKENAIKVVDWNSFIDSFRQVRNNLVHGAKFFMMREGDLGLTDRDNHLVSAALAFIRFLETEGLVEELH